MATFAILCCRLPDLGKKGQQNPLATLTDKHNSIVSNQDVRSDSLALLSPVFLDPTKLTDCACPFWLWTSFAAETDQLVKLQTGMLHRGKFLVYIVVIAVALVTRHAQGSAADLRPETDSGHEVGARGEPSALDPAGS